MNVNIPMQGQMEGWLKLDAVKDGCVVRSTGWFHNLILDAGLDGIGSGTASLAACQVGTGSSAPDELDTALASFLAATSTITTSTRSTASSSPYISKVVNVYNFAAGVATGNVSEVGIANNVDPGAAGFAMFSRALVLDGGGSPTTITVLSDEQLSVTYELRLYPPLSDVVDDFTIDGETVTVTARASLVTDATAWASGIGSPFQLATTPNAIGFSGAIGAITASPASAITSVGGSRNTYASGSFERGVKWTFPTTPAGTFTAAQIKTNYGYYQFGFSPGIPKLDTQTLTMNVTIAWARKSI